ncbi:ubiquinone/menaquinone biosynthesis C-methyltransferase UbiE-like [Hydractinia symbiolongicarpus]|uniref:ubiquinone/menaquinone biosynthesis C-methyltransferase UbiE-like n=1 Tax=Hydractinia symbiolongicarpus TaxID=13093 RepID=UPI00254A1BE1|nr:ubiquinone/menaquinone biosynthesis C-methyltransferase UbiE-like [Hydractinia symbiolongicarpus]
MAINDFAAQLLRSKVEDNEVKILDVACGTGLTGVALQNMGYKIIDGIDLSNEMLRKAKERNIYRNLKQCCINEKDTLPHNNDSYDIVTCIGGIAKKTISIKHALRDFVRVTKPGGTVLIQ